MPGSPNRYFNNYGYQPRQKLVEDLIIQAIRMHGLYIKYMPREKFVSDELFGDHNYSEYEYAFEIEAYVKNVDAFEGQGDVYSKFGMEIKDQITFTIARRRWNEVAKPKLLDESNDLIQGEESPKWVPDSTITFDLEDGTYERTQALPRAGDLIYFPLVNEIFEINFVEHENLFYQHGTLLTYDLKCELFKFSNEEFKTNNSEIDVLGELFDVEYEDRSIVAEGSTEENEIILVTEDGGNILLEDEVLEEKNPTADNSFFQVEGQNIVDFSERSPFLKKDIW